MKAAKYAGEKYYDPEREDNHDKHFGKSTSKIQLLRWIKP